MSVIVHEPTISESTIECEVTPPRELRRFFAGDTFQAQYDVDVSDVPPALAVVPVLAHVCPVAWANGVDVEAPAVDETFLDALEDVGNTLHEMYPRFMEGGRIRPREAVETRPERSADSYDDVGMLFTGGVDSIASYVRHREEDPALITVQGWVVDVGEDDRWQGVKQNVESFANDRGLEQRDIRTNALSFLDTPMLQAHYKRYVDGAWYSSVGHGLGLLALCAPLADALGLETIYIAASHTEEFDQPWGSHPDIDDRVRWTHTRGNHDGFELTRQDKVDLLADYAREEGRTFPLRTCIVDEAGGNCNECEKCYRTMVGLVLAGLDPGEFGYEMDERTFDEIRTAFEGREFVIDEHTRFHWEDIQDSIDLDREYPVAGATEFFRWLSGVDMEVVATSSNPAVSDRLMRAAARNVPYPVYASLYPVYDSLQN